MKKKIIALVCCRGNSRGIPHKNIKVFHNKPLLYWTYRFLRKSMIFDQLILSTDNKKIAKFGKKLGFFVPGLRPRYLSRDNSDQFETHKYIFNSLKITDKRHLVCVVNNNPFITALDIKKSFAIFKKQNFSRIVCDAARVHSDYYFSKQCRIYGKKLSYLFDKDFKKSKINRFNTPNSYVNIFNIKWGLPSFLKSYAVFKSKLINDGNYFIELPKKRNFDLDDKEDWYIGENIFKKLISDKNFIT